MMGEERGVRRHKEENLGNIFPYFSHTPQDFLLRQNPNLCTQMDEFRNLCTCITCHPFHKNASRQLVQRGGLDVWVEKSGFFFLQFCENNRNGGDKIIEQLTVTVSITNFI